MITLGRRKIWILSFIGLTPDVRFVNMIHTDGFLKGLLSPITPNLAVDVCHCDVSHGEVSQMRNVDISCVDMNTGALELTVTLQ